jgi:hypothetical protein
MPGWEGDVGKHVVLAVVDQGDELGPARPQLIGNMAPGVMRGLGISLQEGLEDRGSDHRVLGVEHMSTCAKALRIQ